MKREELDGITANLLKIAESEIPTPQKALGLLANFDFNLVTHQDEKIRKLACICVFAILRKPLLYCQPAIRLHEPEKPKIKSRLYLPLILIDDIIYLGTTCQNNAELHTFHGSLKELVARNPGYLDKKLLSMVPINSKDGLITSLEVDKAPQKSMLSMDEPADCRIFSCGGNFWKNHAEFLYCRVGGGEEDLPLSTEATISSKSSNSLEDITNLDKKEVIKSKKSIVIDRTLIRSPNKSYAQLGQFKSSESNSLASDKKLNSNKSNTNQHNSTHKDFRVKNYTRSSFAQSQKNVQLNPASCDKARSNKPMNEEVNQLHKRKGSQYIPNERNEGESPVRLKDFTRTSAKCNYVAHAHKRSIFASKINGEEKANLHRFE